MGALLTAVLAGSTDPRKQVYADAVHMFERKPGLRAKIDKARSESKTLFGDVEVIFVPELERVERIVVKNARCHAVYDLDQWMPADPLHVVAAPLPSLSDDQKEDFENIQARLSGWPEVGTRMFQRECFSFGPDGGDMAGSWVIVQDGVYRYAVVGKGGGLLVRSVLHEYLATEVYWSTDEEY